MVLAMTMSLHGPPCTATCTLQHETSFWHPVASPEPFTARRNRHGWGSSDISFHWVQWPHGGPRGSHCESFAATGPRNRSGFGSVVVEFSHVFTSKVAISTRHEPFGSGSSGVPFPWHHFLTMPFPIYRINQPIFCLSTISIIVIKCNIVQVMVKITRI